MLVTGHGSHGNGPAQDGRVQGADDLGGVHHLGQAGPGNIQHGQQLIVPILGFQVEEHGAPGVGGVGDVGTARDQVPGQEAVHRAKAQLSALRPLVQVQPVQQPGQLGAGKIGVGNQAGFLADLVPVALLHKPFHIVGGAAALPHNGVMHALPGFTVPQQGGFPLVGDADGGNVLHIHAAELYRLAQGGDLRFQNVVGIVLHPAGLGENLGELHAVGGQHAPRRVKDNGPGAGGSLIQGDQYLLCHKYLLCLFIL